MFYCPMTVSAGHARARKGTSFVQNFYAITVIPGTPACEVDSFRSSSVRDPLHEKWYVRVSKYARASAMSKTYV